MNESHGGTVNAAGKKQRPSSAALALIVGLALLLPGAAALAASNPIPGIDIIVKKNPGGIIVVAPTGADGAYQFKGLAPGSYDLSVGGQRVQTINVDKGSISGVLSRQPDGKASITFNGRAGVVPALPSALVNTSRSNQPRNPRPSKVDAATGGVNPQLAVDSNAKWTPVHPRPREIIPLLDVDSNDTRDSIVAAPKVGDRKLSPIKIVERKGDQSPEAISLVEPAMRVNQPITTKDVDNLTQGTARPPPKDGTFPSKRGDPIPVTGLDLPGYPITGITISLPANPDAKVMVTGDVKPGISDQGTVGGLISYSTAPPPKNEELPRTVTPIAGTEVGIEHDPEGIRVGTTTTDKNGAFHFDKLPAGKYKLKLDGLPDQSLTVGADGIAGGKVMKGPDGSMSIFDRWGNRTDTSPKASGSKAAESPVGFGRGNAGFGGTGPGMVGGGMAPPGAAMGGAGGPGLSPMSGSPGGAMRP